MRHRLILVCLLLVLSCGCINAGQFDLFNYPFSTERDMIAYNYRCEKLLAGVKTGDVNPRFQAYLITAAAFTSTETRTGEHYSIVSFAQSSEPALIRLRGEIGIPPPSGGAIVRVYDSKDDMPPPIRKFFEDIVVNGITWSQRFIAVVKDDRSEEQIANAVSHELVHAYMSSRMGREFDNLPKWFVEGTALYIAGGKTLYVSETEQGERNLSWYTDEYAEYRTIFRYLRAKLGKRAVAAFIKGAIEKRSADELLHSLGIEDEGRLRAQALHWEAMRQVKLSGIMVAMVMVIAVIIWRAHRKAVAKYELEHPEEVFEEDDWRE